MIPALGSLLLRLSEADGPARCWGVRLKSFSSADIDRLLTSRLLVETAPATDWPPCRDCVCELPRRPIQATPDGWVAACPLDCASDAVLDAADLRGFEVDRDRLVATLVAPALTGPRRAVRPGLWHLGMLPPATSVVLSLSGAVANRPALLDTLRQQDAAQRCLVAPCLSDDAQARLDDAGDVTAVPLAAVLTLGAEGVFRLDAPALRMALGQPRLVLDPTRRAMTLDGVTSPLSPAAFAVLQRLAATCQAGGSLVTNRALEALVNREPRDVIREVRAGFKAAAQGDLIQTHRAQGYSLQLPPQAIRIAP